MNSFPSPRQKAKTHQEKPQVNHPQLVKRLMFDSIPVIRLLVQSDHSVGVCKLSDDTFTRGELWNFPAHQTARPHETICAQSALDPLIVTAGFSHTRPSLTCVELDELADGWPHGRTDRDGHGSGRAANRRAATGERHPHSVGSSTRSTGKKTANGNANAGGTVRLRIYTYTGTSWTIASLCLSP